VTFQPVATVRTTDERRSDLDAAGYAMAVRDDGDAVGAHEPDEVSSRVGVGEVDVAAVAGVGERFG
jgi:hypothetical protein